MHRFWRRCAAALLLTLTVLAGMLAGATPSTADPRSCPTGQVWRDARSGGDHTCVDPRTLGRRMTGFDPGRHGFRFSNDFQSKPLFDFRFGGLCGGMSYLSLDHFHTGRRIPQQQTLPATGSPLHQSIYGRQVTSIADNLDKWGELTFNPFGWRNREFFTWGLQGFGGGRLQELREAIDAGTPMPLGLFKPDANVWGPHHQVVAVGYELGRYTGDLRSHQQDLKIFVYDPNFPGRTLTLVPHPDRNVFSYLEEPHKTWRTYFVDHRYQPRTPPAFPGPATPVPGQVTELVLHIGTGGDDLRGGNDNVNATIHVAGRPPQHALNLNNSARWIDHYQQTVRIRLDQPVPASHITGVQLTTTSRGGLGGDNWNVNHLTIATDHERTLFHAQANPLVRFTGDNRTFTARIS
ncbi:hypothetical protein [Streptomyces sp. NPDC051310]|uniref:hypothetical protein n=1 Tax=Streptomyces sp. NPDC051310 TaxID=3365649 RepID=UPI003799725A